MNELFDIKGKVAVITGASGVLGGSIARSFAQQGAKIVALGTKQEKIDATVADLKALGAEAVGFVCDVLNVEALKTVADAVVSEWGKVDILLNIAGGNLPGATLMPDQEFFDMDLADWDKVTQLNMNGTVYPT